MPGPLWLWTCPRCVVHFRIPASLENSQTSYLWHLTDIIELCNLAKTADFHQCAFGSPWRKYTIFLSSVRLVNFILWAGMGSCAKRVSRRNRFMYAWRKMIFTTIRIQPACWRTGSVPTCRHFQWLVRRCLLCLFVGFIIYIGVSSSPSRAPTLWSECARRRELSKLASHL